MAELPPSQTMAPSHDALDAAAQFDEEAEDWFGEGTSFDSGEDLAAALFAMAGAPPPQVDEVPPLEEVGRNFTPAILSVDQSSFKVVEPGTRTSSWGTRETASVSRPPRDPSNPWSIRHGVQILKRTEQMMARLQRDAVEVTFAAAGAVYAQQARARKEPAGSGR